MVEPRSLAMAPDTWLTDSRVYSLIWLGRWLERAEGISRAVNSAARAVAANNGAGNGAGEVEMDSTKLAEALLPVANVLGISVAESGEPAAEILLQNRLSSALHCLSNARLNATQVAPVELIRAISEAIMELQEVDAATLTSPEGVVNVTDGIAANVANIYEAIEDRWFGRESLTEEEVFHRFVQ